jgi:hypothetical protein
MTEEQLGRYKDLKAVGDPVPVGARPLLCSAENRGREEK